MASLPQDLSQFEALVEIIARLRAPGGCPWDREQTHASLKPYLLEESYEVLETLDSGDSGKLCGELGDLLLQIVLHARIATEAGEFKMGDILTGINTKLIHRHPHVFGETKVDNAGQVAHNWQVLKQEERGADSSMLASVPKQLPALSYSQVIQRRVAEAGFDWPDITGVIDKLVEEVNEFKESTGEEKVGEFGDVLFTLVNIARRMGIDSEAALRQANEKFYRRFSAMEEFCRQRGLTFGQLTFDQQNALWEEAKKMVGGEEKQNLGRTR